MDRFNSAAGAASPPTAPAAPTDPYYTAGNPGSGVPATRPGAWFYHMISEELRAVVVEGGLTPDHEDLTQLREAIIAIAIANGTGGSGGLPPEHLSGLTLANNAGTPNTNVDFAAGAARNSADTVDMLLASGLTKILQASGAWAAGTAANGLFTGARANSTWYHAFLIRKDSDGTIDAGFDTSFTAANKPSGYSNYRRIGSVLTDGSGNIRRFHQFGRTFLWDSPSVDVSQAVDNTVAVNVTVAVPTGLPVLAEVVYTGSLGNVGSGYYGGYAVLRNPSLTDVAAANYAANGGSGVAGNNAVAAATMRESIVTNTSAQIGIRSLLSYTMTIATLGWKE